jgi:hypothetical protein
MATGAAQPRACHAPFGRTLLAILDRLPPQDNGTAA